MTTVNVEQLLKTLNLPYKKSGNDAIIKCFNPNHKEKDPSMFVHLKTGMYHCFGCRIKGNILSFVKNSGQLTTEEAQEFIEDTEKGGTTEEEIHESMKVKMSSRTATKDFYPTVKELPTKEIQHNYYLEKKRGFTLEEIHKWNMKTVNDPRSGMHNHIYIPIYYNGILRTWFVRSTFGTQKKYGRELKKNEQTGELEVFGYPRKDIIFGLDNVPEDTKEIYGFEGIFDKIWFDRTRRQSVAFLGNKISMEQRQALRRFKSLVLGLDNDDASLFLVRDALQLAREMEIRIWTPPIGKKDANLCTLDEMLSQIYQEVPLTTFIQSERYVRWSLRQSNLQTLKR